MENTTTWVELEEFIKLSGLNESKITELIEEGSIKSKKEGEKTFVDATSGVGISQKSRI